jgi:hypothetical protein
VQTRRATPSDGTNTYAFPGEPEIHAHIAEKDAAIPIHQGLAWLHSIGQYLYDTPSGDLEVGQYALQANGRYIEKRTPFVSATSSPSAAEPAISLPKVNEVTPADQLSGTTSSSAQ